MRLFRLVYDDVISASVSYLSFSLCGELRVQKLVLNFFYLGQIRRVIKDVVNWCMVCGKVPVMLGNPVVKSSLEGLVEVISS